MARCKNCNNLYNLSDENDKIVGKWCPKINDSPDIECDRECEHFKNMTNADKIRAMNDEELAKYIVPMHFDCSEVCKDFGNGCMHNCTHGGGREFILKWLQSEAE